VRAIGTRPAQVVGVVCTAVLLLAATARSGSTRIVLDLVAGYRNQTLKACTIVHHYTFFKRAHPVLMNGSVTPAPTAATWTVKVKVKRCVAGRFRTVWVGHATGHGSGRYDIAFRSRRTGYFFARAYYYGVVPSVRSDKQYFRLT
jgi:hypothetical protein